MTGIGWILIALGGALGSVARVGLGLWLPQERFPWGTLVANLSGSFLLGLAVALVAGQQLGEHWRLFFALGFCGAFTTFSTFSLQTLELIERGAVLAAFGNVAFSVAGALLLVFLGLWAGRLLF